MAGFDADFEIEILASASKNDRTRTAVRRALMRGTDPWSAPGHRELWKMIGAMTDGDVLTPMMIAKHVDKIPDDDLAEEVIRASKRLFRVRVSAAGYATGKLREWVEERELRVGIGAAIKKVKDGDISGAYDELRPLTRGFDGDVPWEGGDWWATWEDRIEQRIEEARHPDMRPRIPTRLPTLDAALHGGIALQQVGLVVAHTNVGKSIISENFAFYGAAASFPTIYIGTEMSIREINVRMDAKAFGFPAGDFETGNITSDDLDEFAERRLRLKLKLEGNLFTYAVPPRVMNQAMLREIILETEDKAGKKVKLLVVDSPDHMLSMLQVRDFRLQQSAVYWESKQLAAEHDLAAWLTTQASKEYLGKMIAAEATSESYDKARIADIIVTLMQTSQEVRSNLMRALVAKNRGGKKGDLLWLLTAFERMHVEETDPPVAMGTKAAAAGGT